MTPTTSTGTGTRAGARTRTHRTVPLLAAGLALLAAGTAATAAAPPPDAYTQDPAGGDKTMRTAWTKDEHHRLEAQFRFHPGVVFKTRKRPATQEAPDWGGGAPDPATLAYEPKVEFAYDVYSGRLLRGSSLGAAKKGTHDVTLDATVVSERGAKVAEFHEAKAGRPAGFRATYPLGRRVACDSGAYTVRWSITRTGPADATATVRGTLRWDSDCARLRKAFG
ncbi:hypothetical protein [Streptomyces sp. NPDC093225]|uniref:hypothetical protein n=1 Tax=Streptomyces sp. NPDC093225 TaxID=3366034 RepID=UPI00381216BF